MTTVSKCKVFCLAVFFGIILSNNVGAKPEMESFTFPPDIREGQEISFKLTFDWPAHEGEYEFKPPSNLTVSQIQVLDMNQSMESYPPTALGFVCKYTLIYKLKFLGTGHATIAAFDVPYRKPNSAHWGKSHVPEIALDIQSGIPWALILCVILVLIGTGAFFLFSALRNREPSENAIPVDPKQRIYKSAAEKIGVNIFGCSPSIVQTFLQDWSAELQQVLIACYGIPAGPATKADILRKLSAINIPAHELSQVTAVLNTLEDLKFSVKTANEQDLCKAQQSLLQYVKGKIIIGN